MPLKKHIFCGVLGALIQLTCIHVIQVMWAEDPPLSIHPRHCASECEQKVSLMYPSSKIVQQ